MKYSQSYIRRLIRRHKTLAGAQSLPAIVAYILGLVLVVVVLVLMEAAMNGWGKNLTHFIFTAFQISYPPVSDMPKGVEIFHICAVLVMGIISFLLIPVFTAALNNWLNQKILSIQEGRKIYKGLKGHYVLIGFNEFTTQIVSRVLQGNDRFAVILTTSDVTNARERMEALLPTEQEERIIFYSGDGASAEMIDILCLEDAEELYLLDESGQQNSHYSRNMTIIQLLTAACAHRPLPLTVYMQMNNSTSCDILRKVEFPVEFVQSEGRYVIDLRPFNFYENWARLLWSFYALKRDGKPVYDPLDFEPLENTDKHVQLVIAGFDEMGQALLLEAMRLCHYLNYDEATGSNKTLITVFDPLWDEHRDLFMTQYGYLHNIKDIELSFHPFGIASSAARRMVDEWARDDKALLTVALCDPDAETALQQAVNLPEAVFYQPDTFAYETHPVNGIDRRLPHNRNRARVLVRQHEPYSLDHLFAPTPTDDALLPHPAYPHLQFFGTFSDGVDFAQLNDDMALCINGIYSEKSIKGDGLFYIKQLEECIAAIREVTSDRNKLSRWRDLWLRLPENFKWSNRFQVDMYSYYTRVLNRNTDPQKAKYDALICRLAETEHRRWMAERIVAGWRQAELDKEGKINERRIHASLIPYAQLPEEEKQKDFNVIATAPLLVGMLQSKLYS